MTRGRDLADTRSSGMFTRHVAPTISAMPHSSSASNCFDRGEPADIRVRQIIAHFVGDPDAIMAEPPWLAGAVLDVIGMAIADASEVQLARYLRAVATSRSRGVKGKSGASDCCRGWRHGWSSPLSSCRWQRRHCGSLRVRVALQHAHVCYVDALSGASLKSAMYESNRKRRLRA